MASNSNSSHFQAIRDRARDKQWKKFDSTIMNLIAMDASPTDLKERLQSILDGTTDQGEKDGMTKPDSAVAEAKEDTVNEGRPAERRTTDNIDTVNRMGNSEDQPDSPQASRSEAPPYYYANGGPTPAAHIYRDQRGVFVRPAIGYQFREFEGITQVYYDNEWRPLLQDQPEFGGVREVNGWILPIMAGWKEASQAQRQRWDGQGMHEFNL